MTYRLTIEPLGAAIDIEEEQTILDACLRAGVWLPHACCHGLCATCKVQVVDGDVDHGEASPFALMDFERDEKKTLACCAKPLGDLVIEADIDEEPDAERIAVRSFAGSVSAIVDLTPSIKGITIRLDEPLHFQAGQYVNLEIPSLGLTRPFSLANAPTGGAEIELHVRAVPGGLGTGYLHQRLKVGDRLALTGPYGRFIVRRSAGLPMLFMAGGSGLSSPRSMIKDLLATGCTLPITLVYGQRTRAELYGHEELTALASRHSNFEYVPVLSAEPEGSPWEGRRGMVHEAVRTLFDGDFRGRKAYLCGPPAMIDACVDVLVQGRLFERDTYTEQFFSAADVRPIRGPFSRKA